MTLMATPSSIPVSVPTDHDDVSWALTTARTLADEGDMTEALRWLRRAVSAAIACDQDNRAIQLGRAAALLEASLGGNHDRDMTPDPKFVGERTQRMPAASEVVGASATLVDSSPHAAVALELGEATLGDTAASPAAPSDGQWPPTERAEGSPYTRKTLPLSTGERAELRTKFAKTMPSDVPPVPTRHSSPDRAVSSSVPSNPASFDNRATLETPTHEGSPMSQTVHANTPIPRYRVALLASPDGDAPRVLLLADGSAPPPGASIGYLTPASGRDAGSMANLLETKRVRDRKKR